MQEYSTKFIIGMILLLTNGVVGYGGLLGGVYFAKKTGKKVYYISGMVIYGISWGMLALGIYLAGPEGVKLFKQLLKSYFWQTLAVCAVIAAGTFVYFYLRKKNKGKNASAQKGQA